jgi:hypothetical protein
MALRINLKLQLVGANLLWTIPNIKVHYILVAKFPHGKRSLNILSTSFPNPNTQFWLCYSGLFTHNFLPFCNCVYEVNMTHACTEVSHTPICGHARVNTITPSLRIIFYDPKFLTVLTGWCVYISHVGWNTGDTDVMIYYIYSQTYIYPSYYPMYIMLGEIQCDDTQ